MIDKLFNIFGLDESESLVFAGYGRKNTALYLIFSILTIIAMVAFAGINYSIGNTHTVLIDLVVPVILTINILVFKKFDNYYSSVFIYALVSIMAIGAKHIIAPISTGSNILWVPLLMLAGQILLQKRIYGFSLIFLGMLTMVISEYISTVVYGYNSLFQLPLEYAVIFNIATIISVAIVCFLVGEVLITGEHFVTKTLQEKGDAILASKEETAALLSMVSHDIATPLFVINTCIYKIEKAINKEKPVEINDIYKMQENIKYITSIIEKSRELRAMDDGKVQLKLRKVNLKTAICESKKLVQDSLKNKNLSLNIYFPSEEDEINILADEFALTHNVLVNIISNAIKFSHEDSDIDIRVRSREDIISVEIRDFGVGIPANIIPNLFSRNHPTSRKGTKGEKGTGFGLPIVKMFMDLFEGSIDVKSEDSELASKLQSGTLFRLSFKRYIEKSRDTNNNSEEAA